MPASRKRITFHAVVLIWLLLIAPPFTAAQQGAPCGVVNALDYPIDISDSLEREYDDFARFRARFGGLHTGYDMGFRREGEFVHAAARGRVTYADPEGWDTELGVVIIEHTFPDGSLFYTLYGHMVEGGSVRFPVVGACVERGAVIGRIGDPSMSLPHLHYEIRDFMPNDGGPGYVTTNPQLLGWYHPLDFTQLWRARLRPGFIEAVTFAQSPSLPPALLDSGLVVTAADNTLAATYAPNVTAWQITTGAPIVGLAALPGNRVVAQTDDGRVMLLQNGRYAALWTADSAGTPFVALGETLVFLTADGGLAAYDTSGAPRWSLPGDFSPDFSFTGSGETAALASRAADGYRWRVLDGSGETVYDAIFRQPPLVAHDDNGSWFILNGAMLYRLTGRTFDTVASTGQTAGRAARLTVDALGNSYLYLDDSEATLLALDMQGKPRWRISYPFPGASTPPLLDTGGGCLLYALDADGMLNVFSAADGSLVNQVQFYAGGERTGNPAARFLSADADEQVIVGSGFLSLAALDGRVLGGAAAECLLG